MASLLPPAFEPAIAHKNKALLSAQLDTHDVSLLMVNESAAATELNRLPNGKALFAEYERCKQHGPVSCLRVTSPSASGTSTNHLWLAFAKPTASTFEWLQLAGRLCKDLNTFHPGSILLGALGFDAARTQAIEALLAATLAQCAPLPSYKSEVPPTTLRSISVVHQDTPALGVTVATQRGNHLARWLTTLPPNELNCARYGKALQQLAKREGWDSEFHDLAALKKLGAGAFLAVARSNGEPGAGILRLSYRAAGAKRKARQRLALVGKGICFDTGGINLKSHKGMYDMHTDMQGSAVAVGTLLALTRLKVSFDIDCWLAITENEIGPRAYRPQEVIKAANGVTIQVVHSDAEGRMALADTLHLAARDKPDLLLDFATLTGACVAALSERMSGAFTNREELRAPIEAAGRSSGERIWSFPMDADYDSDLDSPIADIMQCTQDNKGDHILAARFLNRFVPESVPWVHIDLSSATRSGGLAHVPTEITGFGVRFAVELVTRHIFN